MWCLHEISSAKCLHLSLRRQLPTSGCKDVSDHLHKSLHTVIIAVNKIKTGSFNDCLFQKLCVETDENFESLLASY